MIERTGTLALRVSSPADVDGHGGNSQRVQNDGGQPGVFQFIDRIETFGHAGLRVDNARVVGVVMQMDIVIIVVFEPPAVDIESYEGGNEDHEDSNVVHEIHKLQGSFLWRLWLFPKVRGVTVRGVIYSFGRMILLFSREYKGVDHSFYREKAQVFGRNQPGGMVDKPVLRDATGPVEVTS